MSRHTTVSVPLAVLRASDWTSAVDRFLEHGSGNDDNDDNAGGQGLTAADRVTLKEFWERIASKPLSERAALLESKLETFVERQSRLLLCDSPLQTIRWYPSAAVVHELCPSLAAVVSRNAKGLILSRSASDDVAAPVAAVESLESIHTLKKEMKRYAMHSGCRAGLSLIGWCCSLAQSECRSGRGAGEGAHSGVLDPVRRTGIKQNQVGSRVHPIGHVHPTAYGR